MLEQVTKENFQQMLSRFTTTELENLIEKFPYFRQAHLLLAKKYQQENNPQFDQQLQLAALYTQDREMLFNIFNERKTEISAIPAAFEEFIEEDTEQNIVIEKTGVEEETIHVEEKTEEITEQPPLVTEEKVMAVEHPAELIKEKEPEAFSTREPHTFDDWLKAFNRPSSVEVVQKEEETEPEEVVDDELNKLIMSGVSNDYLHALVEEETHYSRGLDKFIEEQIQKHKHEEVQKPASENELSPELITETMAKVYEMQKKYNKAVKAYEILALKYPEKNDFFAARINYLKNII